MGLFEFGKKEKRKGQGAFEYILLLAGVLLIVIIIVILLRGPLSGTGAGEAAKQACYAQIAGLSTCWSAGNFQSLATIKASAVPACKGIVSQRYTDAPCTTKAAFTFPKDDATDGYCGFCLNCCGT